MNIQYTFLTALHQHSLSHNRYIYYYPLFIYMAYIVQLIIQVYFTIMMQSFHWIYILLTLAAASHTQLSLKYSKNS